MIADNYDALAPSRPREAIYLNDGFPKEAGDTVS